MHMQLIQPEKQEQKSDFLWIPEYIRLNIYMRRYYHIPIPIN